MTTATRRLAFEEYLNHTVLTLVEGLYAENVFEGNTAIASIAFPQLQLTAEQILSTGTVNG